ncbi:MAG: HNH endonuclease signature motif containing protein [Cyanobacteria bacterium J06614_10]
MSSIPSSLRQLVIQRAGNRCEYCGISQVGQVATFHIDHIVPSSAEGTTVADNLALACVSCSLRKGARQKIEDPSTGQESSVFHPRQQQLKDAVAVGAEQAEQGQFSQRSFDEIIAAAQSAVSSQSTS